MKRIALLAMALVSGPMLLLGAQGASGDAGRIAVWGEGSVEVEPTIAYIQLGVDSFDASARAAVAANHAGMEAVLAALRSAGVAEKDLKTAGYSLSLERGEAQAITVQEALNGKTIPDAPALKDRYRVTNSLSVVVRELPRLGAIVDAAVGSGATQLYGISFEAEDTSAAEKAARGRAMESARAKAEELAALAGRGLGRILRVTDSGAVGSYSSVRPRMLSVELAGGLNFNPGQVPVTVRVDVEYELR